MEDKRSLVNVQISLAVGEHFYHELHSCWFQVTFLKIYKNSLERIETQFCLEYFGKLLFVAISQMQHGFKPLFA